VSDDFFDRLEAELGELARQGTHLDGVAGWDRRRVVVLIRRSAVMAVLVVALAASLVGEFPASASGHALVAQVSVVHGL
jgi:DNA-binding IclR family transcriptional regulator